MAETTNARIVSGIPINQGGVSDSRVNERPTGIDPPTGESEVIAGYESVDPGTVGFGSSGGSVTGKRRGRPPGSRNTSRNPDAISTTKTNTANLAGIETVLFSLHLMAATAFKTPELALDATEAKKLADAVANVAKHYPVVLTEKQLAWTNLCIIAGGLYGTRFVALQMRLKADAQAKPKPFLVPKPAAPTPPPTPAEPGRNPVMPVTPSELYGTNAGVNDANFGAL